MRTRTFQAWTRKAGTNEPYVTTEVRATSKQKALEALKAEGREVEDDKVWTK